MPGLDELGRMRSRDGVDRQPVEVALLLGHERRPAVGRPAHSVEHSADDVGPDGHARALGADEHRRRGEVEAARPAEHLHDHAVALELEHLAAAPLSVRRDDLDELVVGDPLRSLGDDQRARDVAHRAVLGRIQRAHEMSISTIGNSRDAARSHAQLNVAPRGQRRRMQRLRSCSRHRDAEEPAGIGRVAVERVHRLEGRGPETVELADQGGPPFIEQVAALSGKPDPRPPGEKLAPGRTHLLHHEAPDIVGREITFSISVQPGRLAHQRR